MKNALELIIKVVNNTINKLTLSDEQQGFTSGTSVIKAVFGLRQITEIAIKYNKPANIYFMDLIYLSKASNYEIFIHVIKKESITIQIIENIYSRNRMQLKINGKLKPTPVPSDVLDMTRSGLTAT